PDPASIVVIVDPPVPEALIAEFAVLAHQNPLVERYARTGDARAMRLSDLVSTEQLHATALYQRVYGPIGVEYQIAFTLPHERGRILGVAISRGSEDF